MSYDPVPTGELAAVVTYLEMRDRPVESTSIGSSMSFWSTDRPDVDDYRRWFRLVGSRWLWFSRLLLSDAELKAIIHDPKVSVFPIVDDDAGEVGLLELDFRIDGECEIAFLGLVPKFAGQGHGRWVLAETLHLAWREDIARVHVHTCSLDHPAALPAYRRAGFIPYKRAIERFPDPRLTGFLPRDCAPHVPLIV